ncbi:MAG: Lysine exporter protein, partial [Alphaproteobacteria bacterium]|nr:Lysine exporter protein [Alphaproteobacteria bacterium]
HVAYCLGGLALVIAKSVLLFSILKYIGAAYLFYIGFQALHSQGFSEAGVITPNAPPVMSDRAALRSGFITNLFNPKATLFFLALFTQILNPDGTLLHRSIYGFTCVIMTFLWFSVVATILTTPRIKAQFLRFSKWIDRICGAALIALGIRLAVTKL